MLNYGWTTQNILATKSSSERLENSSQARFVPQFVETRALQSPVLHPVLVNVEIMEDLRAASGGAGQKSLLSISHQPLVVVSSHFTCHMLLGPGVQPGMKASL